MKPMYHLVLCVINKGVKSLKHQEQNEGHKKVYVLMKVVTGKLCCGNKNSPMEFSIYFPFMS